MGAEITSCWSSTLPVGAGVEFLDAPLAAFGVLLVLGALVSGLADRSFLSLTAGFVLAGLVLGRGGLRRARLRPDVGVRPGRSRSSR